MQSPVAGVDILVKTTYEDKNISSVSVMWESTNKEKHTRTFKTHLVRSNIKKSLWEGH